MTRVASFSHNQSLLRSVLQHQNDLFVSQTQASTGRRSQTYKGIASDASALVSARTLKSKNETYLKTGSEVGQTLNAIDLHLSHLIEGAQSIRDSAFSAVSINDGKGFAQKLNENFQSIASSLNAQLNGVYLFSGSQTNLTPFEPKSLNALSALPTTDDAFKNDDVRASAQVGDSINLDYGVLANEIAKPLIDIIKNIHNYDQNPATGPLSGSLTSAQTAFLQSQLAQLDSAISVISAKQASNGSYQQRLETTNKQLEERGVFLETFISDIEDVNPAEAITQIQNDRTALEASYRVISSLSELTLTKFI